MMFRFSSFYSRNTNGRPNGPVSLYFHFFTANLGIFLELHLHYSCFLLQRSLAGISEKQLPPKHTGQGGFALIKLSGRKGKLQTGKEQLQKYAGKLQDQVLVT